jgi:GT2 family glycosyltransferase/glycosyltransferase involved in cell wall biosynthesis
VGSGRFRFSVPVSWQFARHPRRAAVGVLNAMRHRLGLPALAVASRPPRVSRRPSGPGLLAYVEERYGAVSLPFRAGMDLVGRYADDAAAFESSADLPPLLAAVRRAAADVPVAGTPDASIIIPVHDALVCTLTCLAALLALPTRHSYEVIVADDASGEVSRAAIAVIGGPVRHIVQETNLGFIRNCNAAAAAARGRHLVFLNNDTLVLPGWLDALVETLEADPAIGLVGSRLLNGDGTLQEAGGIIWRDGTGWNYGRGQDPRAPEFGFVRDVDFCSGASLAIPQSLWRQLGGFDTRYAPAYFEDSDLAFRVRAAGRRVVYQPFSELVHHEGFSHGRDPANGVKAWQTHNLATFVDRWQATLSADQPPVGADVFVGRDRSHAQPHVLFVDHYVPQWDQDAGSRSIFDFMRTFLARGFRVTLWPENQHYDRAYVERLQRMGVEVIYAVSHAHDMAAWLREAGSALGYVFLSRPHVAARFLATVRRNSPAKIIFYGHDLHWQRLEREYRTTGDASLPPRIRATRTEELAACAAADAVFYPSEAECAVVRASVATPVFALPMAAVEVVPAVTAAARNARDLMFVGGFSHTPNVDGVHWFMAEVWPRLVARDPAFRLTIAGSHPPASILALADDGVAVPGWLSAADLAALYARSAVAIVPLRFGAGVKGKVIEAFAHGIPVVSTSIGMQGIPAAGDLAFLADDAAAFAGAIVAAVGDGRLAMAKVARARAYVHAAYSIDAIARGLSSVVVELSDCNQR